MAIFTAFAVQIGAFCAVVGGKTAFADAFHRGVIGTRLGVAVVEFVVIERSAALVVPLFVGKSFLLDDGRNDAVMIEVEVLRPGRCG